LSAVEGGVENPVRLLAARAIPTHTQKIEKVADVHSTPVRIYR